jgi:subtilase family serine protease
MVLFGKDPGTNQSDLLEANLDLQWSGAVARNATIIYVYSQNVLDSLQYAVDQNLAPVISMSYGGCEWGNSTAFRTLAQQANAQGITWVNASGDTGAAGCDAGATEALQGPAVSFPADIPEVTAVGGTEFNDAVGTYWSTRNDANFKSALSYIPEKAWNDIQAGEMLAAGGGGASLIYTKPWWQNGPGVPNDNARDVPDVSLAASAASGGYLLYSGGALAAAGGTSAASPTFAAIISILHQYLDAKGAISKPGLGNINPVLYNMAQNTTGIFHDITEGSNIVPCAAGSKGCANGSFGYAAGPGYDLATGLGSVDVFRMVTQWAARPPGTGTTLTVSASPAILPATAIVRLNATVTFLNGTSAPTGTVEFTVDGVRLGGATLTGSGLTATATLTVTNCHFRLGIHAITAAYLPAGSGTSLTAQATVSVVPAETSTTLSASPAEIPLDGSTVLTARVEQLIGSGVPTGLVAFEAGKVPLGTSSLLPSGFGAIAMLTVKGVNMAPGINTITASYVGTEYLNSSIGSVALIVRMPSSGAPTATTARPPSATTPVRHRSPRSRTTSRTFGRTDTVASLESSLSGRP